MQQAWIDDGDRRFIARLEAASPCESAVTRLIQGIYAREPASARRILRHRIQATEARPSEMCWGMVRVAAKRLESGVVASEHPLKPGATLIEVHAPVIELGESGVCGKVSPFPPGTSPMALARGLASGIRLKEQKSHSDRRIAAVLLASDGHLLGWAVNSSAQNKTLHAEVNLIQSYCRESGPLPRGVSIFTTLKSCKMCAGMIWNSAADPLSIRVFFDQDDPGPKARLTVLNPRSFERMRAAQVDGRPEAAGKRIEFAVHWPGIC